MIELQTTLRKLASNRRLCRAALFTPTTRSMRGLRTLAWLVVVIAGIGVHGFSSAAYARLESLSGEDAVTAAGEGLRREAAFPWYDDEEDGLRPLTLKSENPPEEAKDWAAGKKKARRKRTTTTRAPWSAWGGLAVFMQIAAYGLLVALLILAVYYFVNHTDIQMFQPVRGDDDDEEDAKSDEERMENLPFDVRRPRADLLTEAKRLYEAGRYGEAVVYLFSYQLLQLDKNQWIRLAKGKTNRQYLREIRGGRDLQGILQKTMVPFEDFFFGHYQIERERFESCWGRLDEFHRLVKAEGATS